MNYSLSMKLLYMATIFFQHYNNSYTHQNIKYLGLLALLLVISAVLERNKRMRNVKKKTSQFPHNHQLTTRK